MSAAGTLPHHFLSERMFQGKKLLHKNKHERDTEETVLWSDAVDADSEKTAGPNPKMSKLNSGTETEGSASGEHEFVHQIQKRSSDCSMWTEMLVERRNRPPRLNSNPPTTPTTSRTDAKRDTECFTVILEQVNVGV